MSVTLNPSDKSTHLTLSNGNLTVAPDGNSSNHVVRATTSQSTGKWYWEVTAGGGSSGGTRVGIGPASFALDNSNLGNTSTSWGYGTTGSVSTNNGGAGGSFAGWNTGDVVGVAIDLTGGKIYFSKNGTWGNSADPAAGTGGLGPGSGGLTGVTQFAIIEFGSGGTPNATINFGATAFAHTAPTGFAAYGGLTTITGALAFTDVQDVCVINGKQGYFARLAATEAPDTCTINATAYTHAALAVTESQDSATVHGTYVGPISASFALAEVQDTSAFSVHDVGSNHATMAVTEAQDVPAIVGDYISLLVTTWDPGAKAANITLTNSNLTAQSNDNSNWRMAFSTVSHSDGKWYFEYVPGGGANMIGVARKEQLGTSGGPDSGYPGSVNFTYGYFPGFIFNQGAAAITAPSYTTGDKIGVALDLNAGTLRFYKNGSAVGTSYTVTNTGNYYIVLAQHSSSQIDTGNFGGSSFTGAPVGYTPWQGDGPHGTLAVTEAQDTSHGTASSLSSGTKVLLVVGDSGTVIKSLDGTTWSNASAGLSGVLNDIHQGVDGGMWTVVGNSGALYTADGGLVSWTSRDPNTANHLQSVHFNGSLWVAVGNSGTITTSSDGITWTATTHGAAQLRRVYYGNGLWVTCGASGTVYSSPDAVTWTLRSTPNPSSTYAGMTYANGLWVISGNGGKVITSTDGATWTNRPTTDSAFSGFGVAYDGSNWTIVGTATGSPSVLRQFRSSNGTTWTAVSPTGSAVTYQDIIYANGFPLLVAPGTKITALAYAPILTSTNGTTWTARDSGTTSTLRGIAQGRSTGSSVFVANMNITETPDVVAFHGTMTSGLALAANDNPDVVVINATETVTATLALAVVETQDVPAFVGDYSIIVHGPLTGTETQDIIDFAGFADNNDVSMAILVTDTQDTASAVGTIHLARYIVRIFAVESKDTFAMRGSQRITGLLNAVERQDQASFRDRGVNQVTLRVNELTADELTSTGANLFNGGTLSIYSGNAPDSPDNAPTGTLLTVINLPNPAWTDVSANVATKAGTWTSTVLTGGVAGWFRLRSLNTLNVIDGGCGTATDDTADLLMGNTSLIVGDPITVTAATFGFTLLDGQEAA